GYKREQPKSAILLFDGQGPCATCRKEQRVAAFDAGHGIDSGGRRGTPRRGGLRMFWRKRSAEDFAEEIKAHLDLEADDLRNEGLSAEEAQRRANRAFGSVRAAQEQFYLRSRWQWLDRIARDLRFGFRSLCQGPGL